VSISIISTALDLRVGQVRFALGDACVCGSLHLCRSTTLWRRVRSRYIMEGSGWLQASAALPPGIEPTVALGLRVSGPLWCQVKNLYRELKHSCPTQVTLLRKQDSNCWDLYVIKTRSPFCKVEDYRTQPSVYRICSWDFWFHGGELLPYPEIGCIIFYLRDYMMP
jgi:hypothetical protein